jgi:hypothetical protein
MTDLLAQQLAATANPLDDSDWLDVRRRVRRPRRRIALAAVVAAAAALLAAPAFGLTDRLVDLLQGPPAPPPVQSYFAFSNAARERLLAEAPVASGTLRDRYSPTIAGEARGVAAIDSPDGPIYLWAAPTTDGRECWLIQAGADPSDSRPYGYGSCDPLTHDTLMIDGPIWTIERPSISTLHVRVYDDAITTVDVTLDTGRVVSLPVVSGHALGTVPKDAVVDGYVGRDAAGDAVARVRVR